MILLGWLMIALFFVAETEGAHYEVTATLEGLDERFDLLAARLELEGGTCARNATK